MVWSLKIICILFSKGECVSRLSYYTDNLLIIFIIFDLPNFPCDLIFSHQFGPRYAFPCESQYHNRKIISRYPYRVSAQLKDTEKDGRKKKESSGVSRAQTRQKRELARCGEQQDRRGGKTCRHNVGSAARQLSPGSFIIKRPHPRSGIYLASPACASRGDDPVGMDGLRTTNCGHRRFLPRVEATTSLVIVTGIRVFLLLQCDSFLIDDDRVLRHCDASIGIGKVLWKRLDAKQLSSTKDYSGDNIWYNYLIFCAIN